jgi:hypothetical protein
MRRRKLPYMIRLIRLIIKCVWHALEIPYDTYQKKHVNFWNIPKRRPQDLYPANDDVVSG